ncbi:MAG: class I SAM-dependent methyltransferase [Chlamydiia bacterium]|nr:class I SAM-dependent methyltransferase [Simkania sp.]MCB1073493.1 class I SAM-dependent methyltransferase [Chlamydiia bacterium]
MKSQEDLPIKSFQPFNLPTTSRILDVGCGSGVLLTILNSLGYKNCIGIDPFLEADVHHPNGVSLLKKDFLDLKEKFDLIMFHHVFEHFPNPMDVLLHVEKLLTKSGLCLIRMPDIDSYSFLRYKQNWFSIHAPFHISLPSRSGMTQMIEKTQMTIQDIVGEQLVEFFLYSIGHELGVADYEEHGNRKFIEKYGIRKPPPLHTKGELKEAKQRLKQVKKHNLCDWSIYYIRRK